MLESAQSGIAILSAIATGAGSEYKKGLIYNTFQASSDASHTGTSTIAIEVSNDNVSWIVMGTISVTGSSDTDGFASSASWKHVRANCTAHGDSTNTVTVTMGG